MEFPKCFVIFGEFLNVPPQPATRPASRRRLKLILMTVHAAGSNVAVSKGSRATAETSWPKRRAWRSDHSVNNPSMMISKQIPYFGSNLCLPIMCSSS
jgi:hypothetical protein